MPNPPTTQVIDWEAYDCTRGANVFGIATLSNAVVVGRSANYWARWVGVCGCVHACICVSYV